MIGVSLGKQQYMAPEQRASAAEVDKRADIYSLGVMFFELLTGKLPKGDERITDLVSGLHEEVNAFVRKAMAHRPEDRYADAREFRHALARVYKLSTGISIPGADGEHGPPPTPVPISEQSSAPTSTPPPQPKSGWAAILRGFVDGILGRLRIK
jgi:serine/threonine-protein kinase